MEKTWILLPQHPQKCAELSKSLNISAPLAQILINREIEDPAVFLNPRLSKLKDPFDIPNMRKAVQRVIQAVEKKEKILVYGDYDADGVTGTAILLETLQRLGAEPGYYIPYRYEEGYSLNSEAIKNAKENQIDLIITVDCGISNLAEINLANQLGIDVVVTDHHNIPADLPAAFAIVNPKMIPGAHDSKNLSGAGVAFKFAWAILRELKRKDQSFLTDLLDLVALGTIADIVPLSGENRILTRAGLNILNQRKRLGIKHLADAASIAGEISVHHVSFALAPRINAAGRLEHASLSLKLLKSQTPQQAQDISSQLNSLNLNRRSLGQKIQKEAREKIEAEQLYNNKVLIVKGENWHPGVIGIVASQLAEQYWRPVVLVGHANGCCRGSARSVKGVNVFELLSSCRHLFLSFGGHAGAAGFEMNTDNFNELNQIIQNRAQETISPDQLVPNLQIDLELSRPQLSLNLAKEILRLAPFGEDNPVPLFASRNLPLEDLRLVGSDKKHLKAQAGGLDLIGFSLGHLAKSLTLFKNYDIVYNLESNQWNGFEKVQLSLVDIKPST